MLNLIDSYIINDVIQLHGLNYFYRKFKMKKFIEGYNMFLIIIVDEVKLSNSQDVIISQEKRETKSKRIL